jgi:hypothetical protein
MIVCFYTKSKDSKAQIEFSIDTTVQDLTNILLLDSIVYDDVVYKICHKSYNCSDKQYIIIVEKTDY